MKIGSWNGYNVNLIKDKSMVDDVYWTITDKKSGKELNRFESKASFGQWVFVTGWRGGNVKEEEKVKVEKPTEFKKIKLSKMDKEYIKIVDVIKKEITSASVMLKNG